MKVITKSMKNLALVLVITSVGFLSCNKEEPVNIETENQINTTDLIDQANLNTPNIDGRVDTFDEDNRGSKLRLIETIADESGTVLVVRCYSLGGTCAMTVTVSNGINDPQLISAIVGVINIGEPIEIQNTFTTNEAVLNQIFEPNLVGGVVEGSLTVNNIGTFGDPILNYIEFLDAENNQINVTPLDLDLN